MLFLNRLLFVLGGLAGALAVAYAAGVRQGLLVLLGIGFGLVLQGARFGFTTGWRDFIESRNPQGLWAQMLLLGLAGALTLPLIAGSGGELVGAVAPLTISLLIGAFLFGLAMQITDGCGSGTLYKVGAGAPMSLAVLPTFVLGSFLGASHQPAWISLGGLPAVDLLQFGVPAAVIITVAGCAAVALLAGWLARRAPQPEPRGLDVTWSVGAAAVNYPKPAARWARRWWLGALLLVGLYVLHLLVAGQPWGIVYGVGLWGAKIATALGWSPEGDAFWGVAPHAVRLAEPLLADVTSTTNIGLIYGALMASRWNGTPNIVSPSARRLIIAAIAGLVLGYSSRLAFGCNVGAYLSGIASASLHGWVWFVMAFIGSIYGVRLRKRLA